MTALAFAIGQRLTADLMTDFLALTPQVYTKASTTDRNSGGTGSTYTIDPELAGIPLDVGTYDIELIGFFTVASTTPKLKTQWRFTGTWNTPIRNCIGPATDNVDVTNSASDMTVRGVVADSQDSVYNSAATGTDASYVSFREIALNVTVTVAGTMGLYWAQSASNASSTSLKAGTSFRVRKLNV
ncbi:MAG TPA: hypothetical protein VIR54_19360 [Vicinamibacterales bacterium]